MMQIFYYSVWFFFLVFFRNLYGNSISSLNAPIFGGSSTVRHLSLNDNGIKYITADVFENVAIDYLYLQNNALTIYPIALSKIAPYEM